jgi:glycerophosphoryl diester phosphodiesterase
LTGIRLNLLNRIGRERLLLGHRGVPQEAPENTLSGFRQALEHSLDGVELDVQLCRTGELVVFHDETVNKVTNGFGRVSELSFDELRRLDAGVRFGKEFEGEQIPSLEEVLELLGGRMLINIELKTRALHDDGLEAKVARVIQKMKLQSSVIFSSFNPCSLWCMQRQNPDFSLALLFSDDQPIHLRRAWATHILPLRGVHPRYPLLSSRLIRRARGKGWFVGTWTVDSAADAARLYDRGADIIISNRPAQLREELSNKMGEEQE